MMWNYGYGSDWILSFVCMVWMLLFWSAVIWLIVWIFNRIQDKNKIGNTDNAKEILKIRFAKGDITKKELDSMMKVIDR